MTDKCTKAGLGIDPCDGLRRASDAVCADCWEPYGSPRFHDLVIERDAWNVISPDGDGNGLLCPNCICARLEARGLNNVRSEFRSGALAVGEPGSDAVLVPIAVVEQIIRRIDQLREYPWLPDHACRECRPESDMLVDGFRCEYHALKALIEERVKA